MTRLTWVALIAGAAGFLFGFDMAVISGAEQGIQAQWQIAPLWHGLLVMSPALWGTVLGALVAHTPADRLGRRPTLIGTALLFLLSAAGSALAPAPGWFAVMRFMGGMGVGISSIAAPAYIAEIAPSSRRGALVAVFQLQIVLGILLAYWSNFLLGSVGLAHWRLMLGIEVIPALLFLCGTLLIPESPRWLVVFRDNPGGARAVLASLGHAAPDDTVHTLCLPVAGQPMPDTSLFAPRYRTPLRIAILLALFNQLSGINVVMFYMPRLFGLGGLEQQAALLSTSGVGVMNLVVTLLAMRMIDRAGRRTLLLIGSCASIVALSLTATAFQLALGPVVMLTGIVLFIAAHAIGQGAVIWVVLAEIFPSPVRARGQALASSIHWVMAALMAMYAVWLVEHLSPALLFGGFAMMMVMQLLFTLFMLPETRGLSLDAGPR